MAIAFDASSNNGEAASVSSTTFSHTVGASLSNGILLVPVTTRNAAGNANLDGMVTGVTYAGTALTKLQISEYTAATPVKGELWYLVNPTSGANNVIVSTVGTTSFLDAGASSFSGVDQAMPIVNSIGNNAAGDDPSLSVETIVDNAWTIDAIYHKWAAAMTIDGNRTQEYQLTPNSAGDADASGTYRGIATAANTSHQWTTGGSDDYGWVIGALRPAGVYSSGIDITSESKARGSGSSRTWSHTVPSGFSNTILIVGTNAQDSNHANFPITGVTFNSVALTKVRSDEAAGNNRTELWYLVNPNVTTADIVVTATGTLGELQGFALTFCNVDQASPIDANNGGSGTSGSPSVTLTTVANGAWSVAVCSSEERYIGYGTQALRAGGAATDQTYENGTIATKYIATAAATALGFKVLSSQSYAESCLSLKPSTGAAAGIRSLRQIIGHGQGTRT